MRRALHVSLFLVAAGWMVRPPGEFPPPRPAPGNPLGLGRLLAQARLLAAAGTEAFFINRWPELADDARGLVQTAQLLAGADDVPPRFRGPLAAEADRLAHAAGGLLAAARSRDVGRATELLRRINLQVRELRAGR